jgi:HlyD family secretion protein
LSHLARCQRRQVLLVDRHLDLGVAAARDFEQHATGLHEVAGFHVARQHRARGGDTEIEVPVDEKNLAALASGQVAQCVADAWPDRPFPATVNYIAPGIDATRGTVTIRLRVGSPPDFLRQDMTVTVNVETGRRDRALVVPNDALLQQPDGTRIVLAVRDGRVKRTAARPGLAGLVMTEVVEGLAAGDLVLANAADVKDVAEGDRVRIGREPLPDGVDGATSRELPVNFD